MLPAVVTIEDKFTVDHLAKVLRLKPGDMILAINDSNAMGYIAGIQSIEKNAVQLVLQTVVEPATTLPRNVILAAGLIKDTHWEWMLQKATELGVTSVIPIKTQYSDIQDRMVKPERWQQIVKAAALQSERFSLPGITDLTTLKGLSPLLPEGCHKIILQERANDIPGLSSHLQTLNGEQPLVVAIGPEGGWHPSEIDELKQQGFQPVTLGSQILRADTAAIAALSMLLCT